MLVPSRIGDEDSIRREEKSRLPAVLFVREQHVKRSGCQRSKCKRYKVHTSIPAVLQRFDVIQT
jgi:hypothetical protein